MGAWLRDATVWQRVGRLVPLSWILILVWPLLLLLSRGVSAVELVASLVGLVCFALVWTWFWLDARTGAEASFTAGVLVAMTVLAVVLTFSEPRVWHDGLLGYCMVVAAVWPTWRPSLVAVPAIAVVIFLAVTATGTGGINAFGIALVWLFLGFGFVAVQNLLRENFQLNTVQVKAARAAPQAAPMVVSPRQREIMQLVATGMSDKEIAARLQVSPHTVRTHLQRLYAQHGLRNRAEAAANWTKGVPQNDDTANRELKSF
ncbi:MAG TPA: helix-turn-helix transcriptional regulator [Candidatus Dormibacteraeota bacterium]|nr:helix-turn-helix transcriptional regulator [Candidatus Dormibacteraeota bacterium]